MDCLNTVIGLSKRDCNCLPTKPDDFATINVSKSGYYVDNTDFSVPLNDDIFTDCSNSGIWETLELSRAEGQEHLNAHLLQEITKYHVPRFGNINATIGGKAKYTTNINSLSKDILGVRLIPFNPRGTILTIRSVGLRIAESGTYTIKLINDEGTVLQSQAVTGGSNALNAVAVTWKYRFTKKEPLFIVYDRLGGYPSNSELYCPTCDGSRPYYMRELDVRGVQVTSLTEDNLTDAATNALSHGLFVDFTYQCDYIDWLCDMYDDFWTTTPFGRLYARLYQLYSSYVFNNKIITANKVNYYTLVNGEDLINKNSELMTVINETVPELANLLPNDFVDCFACKSRHNQEKRTLLI